MTYQEIVNRVQDIVNQHKMLADFGYGDISDLKTRFENTSGDSAVQADYPYLFLTPGTHSRDQGMITYNFNMIVMDMARGEVSDEPYNNTLAIQSQCQQYIDDVLAYLYFGYKDSPNVIYSGATYNPFNERFQDDVAGMTLSLSIQVNQPINNCVTPIEPPVICLPELTVFSDSENRFEYVKDPDDSSRNWRWETNTLETPAIGAFNDQYFSNAVTGDFEFYLQQRVSFIKPVGDEVLPQRPVLSNLFASYPDVEPTCDSGNWPTEWSSEPITYKAKYDVTLDTLTTFGVIGFEDPVANESAIVQEIGGELSIGTSTPPPPLGELELSVASTQDQLFRPDTAQSPLRFQDIIVDTQNGWRPPTGSNFYTPAISGTWNWVFEGTTRLELDQGDWPNDPEMQYRSPAALIQPTTSTWPTEQPAVGVSVPFKVEWTSEYYEADGEFIAWNFINDPQPEDRFYIETGSTLKGYFIPTI